MFTSRILSSIIFTLCLPLIPLAQDSLLTQAFLEGHVRPIASIEPAYAGMEDLDFLKSELEGVSIVMLGEQSHGDGASFLAKTRLIKYLHEELNFDVLVFESGLVDGDRVWQAIEAGADSLGIFDLGIFPVWTQSKQVEPLMQYVLDQAKMDSPLILAGFDIQPTGSAMPMNQRFAELKTFLNSQVGGFDEKDYPVFFKLIADPRKAMMQKPDAVEKRSFASEIKKLEQAILSDETDKETLIMARSIRNLHQTFSLFWNADLRKPGNTPHVFNIRDKGMAENMTLLKEQIYPDKKMIVWGANTHLGYGRGFLGGFNGREAADPGMVPMGQYLKIDYQEQVYTISFTSYEGRIGSMRGEGYDIPAATEGTLEEKLSQLPMAQGFLSLRNPTLNDERFAARMYGHGEMTGRWSKMTDAIFYIKTMTESTKR
ncbi:MAG: erythromycin esterase family protein [Roseivirga sp.]|nr:erythromycin esterase family protein [Roseivirga sp.]